VPLDDSVHSPQRARPRGGSLRPGFPSTVNWVLLAYAVLVVAIGGAYAALWIRADYERTLEAERVRLSGVNAALQRATFAMLNDGVGAAVAAASSVQTLGGSDPRSRSALAAMLQDHLKGGEYVRALFLADRGHFVLVSRDRVVTDTAAPAWLRAPTAATAAGGTWVGASMADPDEPRRLVIAVARRTMIGDRSTVWAGALFSFQGFDKLFQQFGSGVSTLGLVSADGTVLAVWSQIMPVGNLAGQSIRQAYLFQRATTSGPSGIVEGPGARIRTDMMYAYDLVSGYPLYVATGQARSVALAGWRARRRVGIATAAAFGVLALITTAFLSHYMSALRNRERDYRALFNNAQFGVFLVEGGRVIEANRKAVSMFGLPDERAAVGIAPWALSPEYQSDGQRSESLAQERIGTALREGGTSFEWLHRRADTGDTFPTEVDISTLRSGDTTVTLAVIHDVTARKRAEHDLRFLSAELMRLQDEERRRIGRDLHDSTGQSLAALELALAQLTHESAALSADARDQLELCARLAKHCSGEIRTASYLLHPPLLDELGLASALRWLADGLRERSAIEVRLNLPDEMERLPPDVELALFRVAQEALTNIHRHSASPWAEIRLQVGPGSVVLEVEDAGRGISRVPAHLSSGSPSLGVGLAGMRERIRQLGGLFFVESTGTGTRIRTIISAATGALRPTRAEDRYEARADSDRG
jgi:PAS domain S-box-containing protein